MGNCLAQFTIRHRPFGPRNTAIQMVRLDLIVRLGLVRGAKFERTVESDSIALPDCRCSVENTADRFGAIAWRRMSRGGAPKADGY